MSYMDSSGATFDGETARVPDEPCVDCGCEYFDSPDYVPFIICAECGSEYYV